MAYDTVESTSCFVIKTGIVQIGAYMRIGLVGLWASFRGLKQEVRDPLGE